MLVQLDDFRISKGVTSPSGFQDILTSDALEFTAKLARNFSSRRKDLLGERELRQVMLDESPMLNFPVETELIRKREWKISPVPADLMDRRVEITGPAGDRKMVINALNSGALTYMADFEDSQSPTWEATIQGQINIRDAVEGNISYSSPEGKKYSLNQQDENQKLATLIVRPRGWHLPEKHVEFKGEPVSASLFDFGLFLYHNVDKLRTNGSGPYFYLPKLESYLEARLWNDVFSFSENELGLPTGTIKATVLIETITAVFEMDEILYELRDHSSGLNCGRWDYIFSFIKKFRNHPEFVLPDRATVTMDKGFLKSYVDLLIKTCHRRGAHAIGGMSAYIPVKGDDKANELAFQKVREDKLREVRAGHDGTWVAHPGLVGVAKQVFDENMEGPNQLWNMRNEANVSPHDLLSVPKGASITYDGLRTNVSVAIQYLSAWLGGRGAVPINNLMEDAATAEICRAQIWQWINHGATMHNGQHVTLGLVRHMERDELSKIKHELGPELYALGNYELAVILLDLLASSHEFKEFLTTPAYVQLLWLENEKGKNGRAGVAHQQ